MIGLALGGGGAKFFAHLGMISVLQENDVLVDYMSCSSMGSIAGALVANNVSVEDIRREFCRNGNKFLWLKPSFRRFGFFSQNGIEKIMGKLLPQDKIEKSPVKFSITAANILDGSLHVFDKGDIITAVKASCAFPGIFPPVLFEDKMLVDGGVLNNIPSDLCRKKVGRNGFVISSSLDARLNCSIKDIHTPFDVYQRIIYLPMYEKRLDVVKKNSDILIEHFKHKRLSLKTGQDTFKLLSKKDLDLFYEVGRVSTLKEINKIKKLLKS